MPDIQIQPLTPERFADLEKLFGKNGAWGGCWCMWWKETASEFDRNKGEPHRRALLAACSERPPGLLAYLDGEPAGWVAIEPREAYPRMARSRQLRPIDDQPVWSVSCFYTARATRRQGLSGALLEAAVAWAGQNGASVVEGYPTTSSNRDYMGVPSTFERAGFQAVSGPRGKRLIMRRSL